MMIPFRLGIFNLRYVLLGTAINFAYADLPRMV
jgi:hypothetical protein